MHTNHLSIQPMHFFTVMLMLSLQACATGVLVTPSPASSAATALPLSAQVTLTSISFKEEGQSPVYTITALTPRLTGSDDPRVQTFNRKVSELIENETDYFRKNLLSQLPVTSVSSGSFFGAQYTVIYQSGATWSLKFDFSGYADGAAHPYHYSRVFNYDLEQGRQLSLDELFLPDSHYLDAISSYCIYELSKRDIGFYGGFEFGADPKPENYRNWNITADGLMITFDEYQVAPYAAGPQIVTVPYHKLTPVIDPTSSLALLTH